MSVFTSMFRRFRKTEDGSASIEFTMLFPVLMFVVLTGFEAGFYMVRNVVLERAVDISVRDIRLGRVGNVPGTPPVVAQLKQRICDQAYVIKDCMDAVQVEMRAVPIQVGGIDAMSGDTACIDTSNSDPQGANYDTGAANSLMVLRVCVLSKPFFPTTGIGSGMSMDAAGNYALVHTSAFVNEPGNRVRIMETAEDTERWEFAGAVSNVLLSEVARKRYRK